MKSVYLSVRARLLRLSEVWHLDLYKVVHFAGLLVAYAAALGLAFWLAHDLRFDFDVPDGEQRSRLEYLPWVAALKLLLLLVFGQFRSLISYFGLPDFFRVSLAAGFASWIMLMLWYWSAGSLAPTRGVILIDFVLTVVAISGVRLALRVLREQVLTSGDAPPVEARRVAVVGAGDVGAALVYDLLRKRGLGMNPVVFVDDNSRKHGQRIHGVPVVGPIANLEEILSDHRIDRIIITMPSASAKKIREVVDLARRQRVSAEIVPSYQQLVRGDVRVDRIRPVELEDLLGREPVSLDTDSIRGFLAGKCVMVTGAGGSIGSELCRQIALRNPDRLLLVEQCEVQVFQVEQEMILAGHGGLVVPVVADVLDGERMERIFADHRPQVVFHAAAHKHVPLMEAQPGEALKNNSFGTSLMCLLASRHQVENFVLISTDKAINPTNAMGASKRLAELALQARQAHPANRTRFMAVRFGNVLGSSGSVIPTFKRQIAAGGPVTVTHRDVTRFFMTIPEAVGLVLQAATMGRGGEIFVLDMGKPVKIMDVARQLIELSGFRPEIDIEIRISGLRPGEKLFEELQHGREENQPTEHPRIMRFVGPGVAPALVEAALDDLESVVNEGDTRAIKLAIRRHVPEYTPYLD